MLKIFRFFLVFLSSFLNANEMENLPQEHYLKMENKPLFVSLGANCEIASYLRIYQLREIAFPFDWILTLNHKKFIEILDTNFLYFLDKKQFFRHPKVMTTVLNKSYELEFIHEKPILENGTMIEIHNHQLNEIIFKYSKRIVRFRQLKTYPGKVYFIRGTDFNGPLSYWGNIYNEITQPYYTPKQAEELYKALKRYFKILNFKLVIVNHLEDYAKPFEAVPGIFEYKIRRNHCNNMEYDYGQMFVDLLNKN